MAPLSRVRASGSLPSLPNKITLFTPDILLFFYLPLSMPAKKKISFCRIAKLSKILFIGFLLNKTLNEDWLWNLFNLIFCKPFHSQLMNNSFLFFSYLRLDGDKSDY